MAWDAMRLLRAVLAALIISSTSATWASGLNMPDSSLPLAETASWPMAAANPQRTSWTPEEIRGKLAVEWYRPIEPYIPYKVQPIAANGTIYVTTAAGLYAFNASNGELLWVYPTELPLGHSPTIATVNGKSVAYVGGHDRKIHAVDALSGQPLAGYIPYEAGAGFETNPLVINDSYTGNIPFVIAGNRDGYLYALNAITGAKVWQFQTGGPVLFSAAYKNGIVYFASNDLYAYAVDVSNGAQVWKSQKFQYSAGFFSYWPVVYTEKLTQKVYVAFTGAANYRPSENELLHTLDEEYIVPGCMELPGPACPNNIIWSQSTASNDPYFPDGTTLMDINGNANAPGITTYYETFPHRRQVYILNADDGTEYTFDSNANGKAEYAPFTWAGITGSGSKYPPVVNGIDNVLYNTTLYFGSKWISRSDPVGWRFGTQHVSRVSSGHHAVDEPLAYSSGGRVMYWSLCCDREAGAFDVTMPLSANDRSWNYYGYSLLNLAPDYQPMYNDGDANTYTMSTGWQMYSGKNLSKNGVYGKHGNTQSPPVPYQGKLYMLRGNSLIAWSGYAPSATKLSLAQTVSVQKPPSPPDVSVLGQRLETEIQKMIAAGPLRTGYFTSSLLQHLSGNYHDFNTVGDILDYFHNPSDTVYTLLLAFPYLSSSLQTQVKAYLQENYGPGKTFDITRIQHVGWSTGAPRESSTIPPESVEGFRVWDPASAKPCCAGGYWQFPPFNFYAAWKYAQIVGNNDQTTARNIFNAMSGKIEAPTNDTFLTQKPYFNNLYIAGYYGYLQLKLLAGLGADPTVQGYYDKVLSLRINSFSKDTLFWPDSQWRNCQDTCANYQRALDISANFAFLTPELAAIMKERIPEKVQAAVDEYQYVAPYWFVNKFDNTIGEGTLQILYDSPSLFQAKAWILGQSYEELVKYLDVPAFEKGDLFYIQNLVAAIEADAAGLSPTFSDVPFSHPYHDDIEALYQAGYTAGCNANPLRYCPDLAMTRAESAVFVERGIHSAAYEPPVPTIQVFADLALDSWAAKWVNGLWQDRYTAGCGANPLTYCPWQGHTRAEGCVFYMRMLRGAEYVPPEPTQQDFADVPLGAWYAKWVKAAYDAGLLGPCGTSPEPRFCPEDPLTRALAARMMVKAKGLMLPSLSR